MTRHEAVQVIEHKPYDCKADVFSFGIVLWELLTGQVTDFVSPDDTIKKLILFLVQLALFKLRWFC